MTHPATCCEYCRGTLGYDSAGTCAGCGAPRPVRHSYPVYDEPGVPEWVYVTILGYEEELRLPANYAAVEYERTHR